MKKQVQDHFDECFKLLQERKGFFLNHIEEIFEQGNLFFLYSSLLFSYRMILNIFEKGV